MKALYKKYKREVWVGVIVSLITTAILKFGDWLVAIIPSVGISIFEALSDVLYILAASHSDNLLLRILLLGGFSVLVGSIAGSTIDGIEMYKSSLRLEKKSKKFSSEEINKTKEEALTELKNESEQDEQNSVSEIVKKGKKLGKSAILTIVLIVFTYVFITFFITTPMSLSNQFDKDIIKIAPYVEESEITQLKSEWVCMESKSDYDEIYDKVNMVKEEHDLP